MNWIQQQNESNVVKIKIVRTDMPTFLSTHLPVMIKKINEQGKKEISLIQLKSDFQCEEF